MRTASDNPGEGRGAVERRPSRRAEDLKALRSIEGLSLSSAQVLQFFKFAPFAVAVFDREMRYIAVSQKWVDDYMLSGEPLLGRCQYDVFPDMSDDWRERYEKCLSGHSYKLQEGTYTREDGQEEWVQWQLSPWKTERGKVGGVVLFSEFITEKKLKELEIEKSQTFLTAVLENVQDGIVACDSDGILTLFNAATRNLHGLSEQSIGPEEWADQYDLYHPDGVTPLAMENVPLFRALKGEIVRGEEMVIAPKALEPRRVLSRGQAMFDSAGNKIGAVATMHDITEESKISAQLKEREHRYRTLYNRTPVMLHSVDPEGRLIRVSDYWLEKLGYERDEVIGQYFSDFLPDVSRDYVRDHILPEFVETGILENKEFSLRKKSGEIIEIQISAIGEYDDRGGLLNSLTVLTDVTERKRMERALRRSEAQFRGAFQTSPQGMALVSPAGTWLTANTALCDMFGYSEKELLGLGIEKLTHPEDLDTEVENIRQMLAGDEQSFQFEKRYRHKDGSTIWALVSITLVRDDNNEPVQFVFQMLDLTKRREMEQQLLQSQKLEAVGQLTGGLAHDFNNLLAVNLISLQLLERTHLDDEKSLKRIRAALDATERGAELTRRLLTFSRRQTLEQRVINVNHLIKNMKSLLKRTLGGAVNVEFHTKKNLWPIEADESQLESAILNLAINGRDAMPEGGDLTIETRNVNLNDDYAGTHTDVKPGRYVLIAVTDTGTGIPEDVLEKVFQPFFTTKDVGHGTGLGLSMVYGFVKQSDGHVEIYSEVGTGTSIKLYLPATDADVATEDSDAAPVAYDDVVGGTETVLVAEDDRDVRLSVKSLLESLGYTVIEAADGHKAIQVLESKKTVDLLFSDIVMPGGLNGVELADQARALRPDLKVLLTTGFAEVAITRNTMPSEATEIIGKPYRREDLAKKIRGVLDV